MTAPDVAKVAILPKDRKRAWPFRPVFYEYIEAEWMAGKHDSEAIIIAFAEAREDGADG